MMYHIYVTRIMYHKEENFMDFIQKLKACKNQSIVCYLVAIMREQKEKKIE